MTNIFACHSGNDTSAAEAGYSDVQIAGAMKNVMWKGELQSVIDLDTIRNKKGLYGLGPVSYLRGEILINDGKTYVSTVLTDTTMSVKATNQVSAPFFVYGYVQEWESVELPGSVKNIQDLETFLDERTKSAKRPFVFKLTGPIASANIHVQNLPEGTTVSSPAEAHQGQKTYALENADVAIIGFFSTGHQGIFTHHDSFVHMHLITADEQQMGHVDEAAFQSQKMTLYLPMQ
ncbi:MAG: acetolactate decarboxylase [Lewinella sp.]|nr:acetolactate decarboxylase [Lewinella sp.]